MIKLCSKCKQTLPLNLFSKDKGQKSGYRCVCKSCSKVEFQKFKESEGYIKRLSKTKEDKELLRESNPIKLWAHIAYHNAKKRAKEHNVPFTITKQWVEDNAVKICPLLEIPLVYGAKNKQTYNAASLDRINPLEGYTTENTKVISFKANRIKSDATLQDILKLAQNMQNY
jgi:hypothetical protein